VFSRGKRELSVKVLRTVSAFREWRKNQIDDIGFVPTMGALHAGHKTLVIESQRFRKITVVSIFVNPIQFDDRKDLETYPRQYQKDLDLLAELGVNAVFIPSESEMFPGGDRYHIDENKFSRQLCGASRPGHFRGMLTIVMKLLQVVKPSHSYFGEKDYQQLSLVRGMVEAFFLDCKIEAVATVRENDGLALSSRNLNLSLEQRKKAPQFFRHLQAAASDQAVASQLKTEGFRVDYVKTYGGRRYGAVYLDEVRLIDNVQV